MSKQKLLLALLVPFVSLLVACGGDDGDNVTIEINNDGGGTEPPPIDPPPQGDCASAGQADFVTFNDDLSVGTLEGTVNTDYTLTAECQWQLQGTVIVGDGNICDFNTRESANCVRDDGGIRGISDGSAADHS